LASGVLETLATSIYNHIQNTGKLWLSFFIITIPLGLLFVIVAFFLVPLHGAIGLGIANITITGLSLVLTAVLSHCISRHLDRTLS
jgi:O-antigen/teichoic acid export membrane protein